MRKRTIVSYAQKQLPFNGSGTRAIAAPHKREWRILSGLAAFGVLLTVLYGYFVAASVAEVAFREDAVKDSRALSATLGTLESTYLEKTRGITEGYARSLGYVTSDARVFVPRSSAVSYVPDAQ